MRAKMVPRSLLLCMSAFSYALDSKGRRKEREPHSSLHLNIKVAPDNASQFLVCDASLSVRVHSPRRKDRDVGDECPCGLLRMRTHGRQERSRLDDLSIVRRSFTSSLSDSLARRHVRARYTHAQD